MFSYVRLFLSGVSGCICIWVFGVYPCMCSCSPILDCPSAGPSPATLITAVSLGCAILNAPGSADLCSKVLSGLLVLGWEKHYYRFAATFLVRAHILVTHVFTCR